MGLGLSGIVEFLACDGGSGRCVPSDGWERAIQAVAVARVVSAVAVVLTASVVRRDRRGVDRSHVFGHGAGGGHLTRWVKFRDLGGRRRFREFVGLRHTRTGRIHILEIIEFAQADLFADDVNIIRHVHLLERLGGEPGQKADDGGEKHETPESKRAVRLGSRAVKGERSGERAVDTGPEKAQQDGDEDDENDEPIPPIHVDENVEVDCHHGGIEHENPQPLVIVDLLSGFGDTACLPEEQVSEVEADGGLIETIEHVGPELELRPFLLLDAASVQVWYSQGYLVTNVLV